jgi:hypothetical protein
MNIIIAKFRCDIKTTANKVWQIVVLNIGAIGGTRWQEIVAG